MLLNHILKNPGGRKICVIENEVGAISIDHSLLLSSPSESSSTPTTTPNDNKNSTSTPVLVLKNGCMCCSATGSGDELSRTLERLLMLTETSSSSSSPPNSTSNTSPNTLPFDYVIIETSGMVDPAPLVQTFYEASLNDQASFTLDGIITMVDTKHITYHLSKESFFTNTKEAQQQIAYADLILLNKIDMVNNEEKYKAKELIQNINPYITIYECTYGNVDINLLLNRTMVDINTVAYNIYLQQIKEQQLDADNNRSLLIPNNKLLSRHTNNIETITLIPPTSSDSGSNVSIPVKVVLSWLQRIVQQNWKNLYRIKGILYVHDTNDDNPNTNSSSIPYLFVIHGIHAELQGTKLNLQQDSNGNTNSSNISSITMHQHHNHHDKDTECSTCSTSSLSSSNTPQSALIFIGKNLSSLSYTKEFHNLYTNNKNLLRYISNEDVHTDTEPKTSQASIRKTRSISRSRITNTTRSTSNTNSSPPKSNRNRKKKI